MATSKTVVGSIDNPGKPGGQGFESPQARWSEGNAYLSFGRMEEEDEV